MKKYPRCPRWSDLISITVNLIFLLLILTPQHGFTQQGQAKYGGTVLIGMKGDFDSLNELNASDSDALQVIQNMLFMTLTRLDEKLQFAPYLAQSWTFSPGDTVLTYQLRQDVFWTDGTSTTAEDVLFTYQLATNPKVAYPASSRFDLTERVEAVDRFSVRFHFKKPYPDALSDTQIPILPRHILGHIPPEELVKSKFNRQPVGNGPFKLTEWRANEQLIFEANDRHAFGRPFLDRVVFQIMPDENVLLTNLMIGELDLVPSLTPSSFKRVQSQTALQSVRFDGRGFTFVGWNLTRSLFDQTVRRALTHAVNKQEIIATLLEGFAQPARGPLLPFVWAFDENLPAVDYDPQKAQALLKQAGWTDSDGDGILDKAGQKLEFTIRTNAGSQIRKDTAVMLQAQWRQIGVKAHIEALEWNLFLERVFGQRDFDAVIMGWDADFTVNPTDLWHSNAVESGYNFVSYRNPRVDWLLEQGRLNSVREAALPVWYEFQKIIVQDAPYTFLFIPDQLTGFNKRIQGVKMDVRGFLSSVTHWWIPADQRKSQMVIKK
ncbi:MAG: peptide-binding protein [bacterium]